MEGETQINGLNFQEDASKKQRSQILTGLENYIHDYKQEESTRTLTLTQMTVFENLYNFLAQGGESGYVTLPTGTGKTVLFTEVIKATNTRSLIIVPSIKLVHQTAERINQFAPNLKVGKVFSSEKDYGQDITITTNLSLVNSVNKGNIKPENYSLVIIDEAHKNLTDQKKDTINKFKNAIKLGFTATPEYSEIKKVSNLLPKEIHQMTIPEAIQYGLLCGVKVIVAKTKFNIDFDQIKITHVGGEKEYSRSDLEKAINIQARNKAAVNLYKEMFKGEQSIAYCVSIKHAQDLAREFSHVNISASAISSETPKKDQEKIFEDYHDGKINILCNADLLIEGFDEPKTAVCLNLRPTLSKVLATQRAGRALRLDRSQGKGNEGNAKKEKKAVIVEFIDENKNGYINQVLFSDILGFAEIPGSENNPVGNESNHLIKPDIEIEGLQVITDVEQVMEISRELTEYQKRPDGWMSQIEIEKEYFFPKNKQTNFLKKAVENYQEKNNKSGVKMVKEDMGNVKVYSPEIIEQLILDRIVSKVNNYLYKAGRGSVKKITRVRLVDVWNNQNSRDKYDALYNLELIKDFMKMTENKETYRSANYEVYSYSQNALVRKITGSTKIS